ncbi:MAG: LuxR C-terminal-related transcriptional regulator [Beutenbergiaceae bacterium]
MDVPPPIVLLQAPRGYGKTVAGSWMMRHQVYHDHVWVSLPQRELTPEQFWEIVAARLREAGLEDHDWRLLDRSLARRRRRLLLTIDDLHRVLDSRVDEELAWLAAHHEQIHVVAMSRHPRLLATLATQLDGVVAGTDGLRLGGDQTYQLATGLGHQVTPLMAADLSSNLWGCPALLRAVLAAPPQEGGGIVIDGSTLDPIIRLQMSDYQDPAVRNTLLTLAVPPALPDDLALRLVGPDGLAIASAAMTDNGTTMVRSRTGEVRLPEPIRAAMARLLEQDAPAQFREASLAAAQWFYAHEDVGPALLHAIDAEHWPMVTELLLRHWAMLLVDYPQPVRRALDRLPSELINTSAELLVARDYVANVLTNRRARAAYNAGLLVPGASMPGTSGRRFVPRQVLSLQADGFFDTAGHMVGDRPGMEATNSDAWSSAVVSAVPGQLVQWSVSLLLGQPGVEAIYGFCEAAAWAQQLGMADLHLEAAGGAALSHAIAGNPSAAKSWLDHIGRVRSDETGPQPSDETGQQPSNEAVQESLIEALTRALVAQQQLQPYEVEIAQMSAELPDLEVLAVQLRAEGLIDQDRGVEAVRLLQSYRVRNCNTAVANLVEHTMIGSLVEAHLAVGQVERARSLLKEADANMAKHPATWMLVEFQSGEYERVQEMEPPDDLLPRQTLQMWLLWACAALRREQKAVALDAFQTAVSIAMQTGMLRPFSLIPAADLQELAENDVLLQDLLAHRGSIRGVLAEPQDGGRLSARELQVLEAVATGAPFAAVASRLYISPNTVKSQMRDIYRKLGVRGRVAAVERAQSLGLLAS